MNYAKWLVQWLCHVSFLVEHFPLAYALRSSAYLSAMFNVSLEVWEREKNGQEVHTMDFFFVASFPSRRPWLVSSRGLAADGFISCVCQISGHSISVYRVQTFTWI